MLDNFHRTLAEKYYSFAQREVLPLAAELDAAGRFPTETIPKLAQEGILGTIFPKCYGGQGLDAFAYALAVEQIARCCASTAIIVSCQNSLAGYPLLAFGTEAQKQKYLVPLAKGEILGSFGLTERCAGTDSASQQTTARREGDHYVLNGSKIFITNAGYSGVYIIFAMTAPEKGNHGISAFIVESDTPGFTVGDKMLKMGIRGSATAELFFDNCMIPAENLLGEEGQGFKIAMQTLDSGRIGVAAQALGIAQGAIDVTIPFVTQRIQFGKRISEFQNTQFELAAMQTRVEAARQLVYEAAVQKDAGQNCTQAAAMAKLFAAETASDVTRRCLQLFGGIGYTNEHPIERMMRDAKITEIYEGTSEVQKIVIAGKMGVK